MLLQEKLYQQLRDRILCGEWGVGDRLPCHRALSLRYSVAIATVTKAIRRLQEEGLVSCCPGRGTVVCPPRPAEVRSDNHRVMLISPYGSGGHDIMSAAINEVFMGTQWQVETYHACAHLDWYQQFLRSCHETPPAGLLLLPVAATFFTFSREYLPVPGTKTVICGYPVEGIVADSVSASAFGEGILLGDYLVERGFRDILYVTHSDPLTHEERETLLGVGQVLRRHGASFDLSHVRRFTDVYSYGSTQDPDRGAYEYMKEYVTHERLPELFLAGHDGIGRGIFRALQSRGVSVPGDVSLLSAASGSSAPVYVYGDCRLASFDNQWYLKGRLAAERLLSRLEGNTGSPLHYEVMGQVKEGETVGNLRR